MKYGLVFAALAACGFWAPTCDAQSVLPVAPGSPGSLEAPAAIDTSRDIGRDADSKRSADDPCGEQSDNARKADCFAHRSLSIGTFIAPLFMAGPEFAMPPAGYPREWRRGPAGFGRLYGDGLAAQSVQQTSRFLTGLALHEDLRYSPAATQNPLRRAIHAITFAAIDRSDSGRTILAVSNFLSSAAGGYVGNAYLPRGYNDTSHALTRTGFQFGSIVVTNLVTEFRPELRQLGRTLHLPDHSARRSSAK